MQPTVAVAGFGVLTLADVSLKHPLVVVDAVSALSAQLRQYGYELTISDDIKALGAIKAAARGQLITPYFDETVAGLTRDRVLWMMLSSPDTSVAGLQAFRLDDVTTSLFDWATSYTIGLYMQRGEMLVPSKSHQGRNSVAHELRGRLVYNGELWIAPKVRNRLVYETFSKLGLLLSLVKWIPDCVWALAERTMATHGHPIRGGYSTIENGFFRWQWAGKEIPNVEWLHIADRRSMEHLADEVCFEIAEARTKDASGRKDGG